MQKIDTGRRFVNLLTAFARALDKLLQEIILADPDLLHPQLKLILLFLRDIECRHVLYCRTVECIDQPYVWG